MPRQPSGICPDLHCLHKNQNKSKTCGAPYLIISAVAPSASAALPYCTSYRSLNFFYTGFTISNINIQCFAVTWSWGVISSFIHLLVKFQFLLQNVVVFRRPTSSILQVSEQPREILTFRQTFVFSLKLFVNLSFLLFSDFSRFFFISTLVWWFYS